ncbi:MAG: protein TolR [Myxococcales bacterium]|nr:protein TolR [Myxococcales bacterium]
MSSGSSGGMLSEINVTPMVDVMLVLLIIFMVAAPMIQTGVPVDLPQARAQTLADDEGKLVMTVTRDQKIYLGKTMVADCPPPKVPLTDKVAADQYDIAISNCVDAIVVKLQTNEKLRGEHELYLHADQVIPYGFVVKVMAAAKSGGADKLGMVTDPLQ